MVSAMSIANEFIERANVMAFASQTIQVLNAWQNIQPDRRKLENEYNRNECMVKMLYSARYVTR
jgi:hypothetical protein